MPFWKRGAAEFGWRVRNLSKNDALEFDISRS
jgi:hypothetical protein